MKTRGATSLPLTKLLSRDFNEEERQRGAANSRAHPAMVKRNPDGANGGNLHSPKWLPLRCA
jgi:hypothetical protein